MHVESVPPDLQGSSPGTYFPFTPRHADALGRDEALGYPFKERLVEAGFLADAIHMVS